MTMTAHRCPVCEGQGCVSRPPHVPADQPSWMDGNTGPYACRACNGRGYLVIGNATDGPVDAILASSVSENAAQYPTDRDTITPPDQP